MDTNGYTNVTNQEMALSALRFGAWLMLGLGVVGALVIWTTMGISPYGVGLGFASLFYGVVSCPLVLVVCSIGENLIAIRKNTSPASSATGSPQPSRGSLRFYTGLRG